MAWLGEGKLAEHRALCPLLKMWRQVVKGKVTAEECRETLLAWLEEYRMAPRGLIDRNFEVCPLMAHVWSEDGMAGRPPKCLEFLGAF